MVLVRNVGLPAGLKAGLAKVAEEGLWNLTPHTHHCLLTPRDLKVQEAQTPSHSMSLISRAGADGQSGQGRPQGPQWREKQGRRSMLDPHDELLPSPPRGTHDGKGGVQQIPKPRKKLAFRDEAVK